MEQVADLALDVAARSRVGQHSDTHEAARRGHSQTMVIRWMNTSVLHLFDKHNYV